MRIGVNCCVLEKKMGGLRQYFLRLFKWLLAHDKDNIYIFFHLKENIEELDHLGNDTWKINAVQVDRQCDIVRYLDRMDLYFCPFGSLWPRPLPLPCVTTLVDVQEKHYPRFFSKDALWNREKYFAPSTRMSDRIITISEFSKESIVLHHRISPQKVEVAYLSADESYKMPLKPLAKSITLPDEYIFFPANRWLHKNHDNLLKALVVLNKKHHLKVNCILTGFDVPEGYPLEQKKREYNLVDQVKTVGYVDVEAMKHIYKKARMLCFPSLFEGFGMPVVEAMAAGCPVVCANVTSLPEIAGDAALYFDPVNPEDIAEKIKQLWMSESMRAQLIEKGCEKANMFSSQKTALKHIEVFKQAAGVRRKGRYLFHKYVYNPFHLRKMSIKRKWLR